MQDVTPTAISISTLIEFLKPLSGLLIYLLGKGLYDKYIRSKTSKTDKETEEIAQGIEFKYAIQVQKWLSDLEEIKSRHDLVIEKKDATIKELQNERLTNLKEITTLNLRIGQCGRAHRRLFTKMNIPYWECDQNGKLIYANGAWLKLFGLEEKDALGEGWLESVPEPDRQKLLVEWYSKVIDESDGTLLFQIRNPLTGESKHVEAIYAVKFNEKSEVYKIVGVTLKLGENVINR